MREEMEITEIGQVIGTKWFCSGCGEGVFITSDPVPGLLLNMNGSVHKHNCIPVTAGYLEDNPVGIIMANELAERIDRCA